MDFDKNQFLTDIFETLVEQPGDPVRQIDYAIHAVIEQHVKALKRFADQERTNLLDMAEEKRANPKEPVKTRWRYASENYDRR